jgi:hypothetical protein
MISSRRLVPMAALCVALACILGAGCDSRRELSYRAFADAVKAGEITRDWIPDYLPKTSRAIHLVEQDSPSREWCGFEFLPTDPQSLRESLKIIDALPPSVKRVRSPDVPWWPDVLKGNLDVEKIHQEGFELYVVEKPADSVSTWVELYVVEKPADSVSTWVELFAIDWRKGRGFFYGTRE